MQLHILKTWSACLLLLVTSSAWAANHQVTVGGTGGGIYGEGQALAFDPPSLTIAVGDTVTFTNAGGTHNVAADDHSFRCANGCDSAGGSGTPSSSAWSATVTFNQAGSFGYHCEVHQSMGMVGSITVQGAAPTGNVAITKGFTGAWYDHTQSGHGILLEVLPNNVMFAYWFTFNPEGTSQAWFGGTGAIVGDTAVVGADQALGGRWIPNFDPSQITLAPWGTLTFTFTDCTHGRVDFTSTASGFGTNHMLLDRLTIPAGVTCP